jgi:hypothetical protein
MRNIPINRYEEMFTNIEINVHVVSNKCSWLPENRKTKEKNEIILN